MNPVARILDANLNRAREGMRACEEYARLVLNDARAAAAAKELRGMVRTCVEAVGGDTLLAARDIDGDVGVSASVARRKDAREVAEAGIKRAQEALRVIEEYASTGPTEAAGIAARARYAAYRLEQELFIAGPRRVILRDSPVMVIFTRALCRVDWRDTARSLVDAGARLFQLREKDASAAEQLSVALVLKEILGDGMLIVNDRVDVALAAGAAGAHLGLDDLPLKEARSVLGAGRLIGASTHNMAEAAAAEAAGADYLGLGCVFPTGTKKVEYRVGPDEVRTVAGKAGVPVFAIGGITPENADELAALGVRHVAASAALLGAADPGEAWRALAGRLVETR